MPERTEVSTTVLIIDDEPLVLRYLRVLLEIDGHAVYEAMTGPIGLGLIPAVDPDVVVLDVMMPGMDGIETCSRIHARFPDLPVVVLTARDDRELEDRCLANGASKFLTKPLRPGQLEHVVALMASGRSPAARPPATGPRPGP